MLVRSLFRTTAILLAVLSLGCANPLSPENVEGTYELVQPKPPEVIHVGGPTAVRILSETILLRANGTGMISFLQQIDSLRVGSMLSEPFLYELPITFRLRQDRIEIAFVCGPLANCIEPPHLIARRIPGGLVSQEPYSGRVARIYTRRAGAGRAGP